ncbi:hypothetical protein [Parageobacillus thermoglucosidasius]|uniref:Uncharacterized protein n=1 Tax=Parageobacillus thermoglucosidasius TaxID=1426 RepID=A0AB38R4S3_PARTM|nr:hypothetical protein [Parageobacillus thermoglucosidasius]UOE78391.1 hypothetical protein IMI45_20355 [Parageobacillus thermoglucosidasius]
MINIPLEEIANNLNDVSWDILNILRNEPVNFIELKSRLSLGQEKVYKELARLEGACLIHFKKDPKDQRSNIYYLTNYGKSVFKYKK